MRILAIETSCDDTGIAILDVHPVKSAKGGVLPKAKQFDRVNRSKFNVLSNIVSSQIKIHKKYGGVFPMMAKREHQKNLTPVLKETLRKAKLLKKNQKSNMKSKKYISKIRNIENVLKKEENLLYQLEKFLQDYEKPSVDLIAVTNGPGLEPCLWVGVNFAKVLSYFWNISVVPVNHIESHILVNFLDNQKIEFPAISLIVSGGHTQLILVKGIGKYKIIGETRDDAAGECFDKCAKILGLEYPGGPIISKLAAKTDRRRASIKLPRPMINTKDYDFSFSGLKTAVLYKVRDQVLRIKDKGFIQQMCFEIQQAIVDVLIKKTINAAKNYKVKTIILGGGVSANKELREQLKEKIEKDIPDTKCLIPDYALSTDNALMIAITGYFNKSKKTTWEDIEANANLRIGK